MDFSHQTVISNNQRWESSLARPRTSIYTKTKGTNPTKQMIVTIPMNEMRLPESTSSCNPVPPLKKLLSIIQKPPVTVKRVEKYHKKYYSSTEQTGTIIKFNPRRRSVSPSLRQSHFEDFLSKTKVNQQKPRQALRQRFNRRKASIYDFDKEINGVSVELRTMIFNDKV